MTKVNRRWMKHEIHSFIQNDDRAVCRAILALFNQQTVHEQNTESTCYHNKRGFTGADAGFFSSLAKQISRYNSSPIKKYKLPLSPKQIEIARPRLYKYATQLTKIANNEL